MAPPPRHRRHNQGGGDQPKKRLLNERRVSDFRYFARQVLAEGRVDQALQIDSVLQSVTTKAARLGITEAKEFVREREKAGVIDARASREIQDLLDRYAKMR